MFNKSLNTILGTFSKVQADLTSFVARTETESSTMLAQALELQEMASAKQGEIARANVVIEKISALIN